MKKAILFSLLTGILAANSYGQYDYDRISEVHFADLDEDGILDSIRYYDWQAPKLFPYGFELTLSSKKDQVHLSSNGFDFRTSLYEIYYSEELGIEDSSLIVNTAKWYFKKAIQDSSRLYPLLGHQFLEKGQLTKEEIYHSLIFEFHDSLPKFKETLELIQEPNPYDSTKTITGFMHTNGHLLEKSFLDEYVVNDSITLYEYDLVFALKMNGMYSWINAKPFRRFFFERSDKKHPKQITVYKNLIIFEGLDWMETRLVILDLNTGVFINPLNKWGEDYQIEGSHLILTDRGDIYNSWDLEEIIRDLKHAAQTSK